MPFWSPQHYKFSGERQGISPEILEAAVETVEKIRTIDSRLPPILTLRHMSVLTDTPFFYLDKVVSRDREYYKRIHLRKKMPGRTRYRQIDIPETPLLQVQRWIAENILRNTNANQASFAYHPDSQPIFAAKEHCGCNWLLKVDIEDFFHSISEGKVFFAFKALGYSSLVSFELARITTMTSVKSGTLVAARPNEWTTIQRYKNDKEGCLPQGAPTSPMLSNLVMKRTDDRLTSLAACYKFKYTRYSDDMAFSTADKQTLSTMKQFKRLVLKELLASGFKHNRQKTAIRGPGARRIVLGILVDGNVPRLPKQFKDEIRQHLYYLKSPSHGPSKHAETRNTSVSTLYHHVRGKIGWAKQVEHDYGANCLSEFEAIAWPPLDIDR